jgi:hypothetical protein
MDEHREMQEHMEVRQQKTADAYATACHEKDEGTAAFKTKQYAEAVACWGSALRSVDMYRNTILQSEMAVLREALHNNRAMAQLQLKNYAAAEADCFDVIFLDPKNQKALFRRAQARVGRCNWPGCEP